MKKVSLAVLTLLLVLFACAEEGDEPFGAACEEKEDCESGFCLQEERWGESTGWTGGYCTKECAKSCGRKAKCIAFGNESYCMAACDGESDCRSGYLCHTEFSVCIPDCRRGWDCGDGYACDENGICVDKTSSQTQNEPGGACEINADCESEYCLPESLGWPAGMCSAESEDCPDDFTDVLIDDINLCLPECSGRDDCRDGYLCNPIIGVCLPDCRQGWDCGSSMDCNNNGFCTPSGMHPGKLRQSSMDCASDYHIP